MTDPTPSSIPPRRARYGAVTALITALATLVGAIAFYVTKLPAPATERPAMETKQPTDPPLGKPDKTPTTDDGVIASRVLQERANTEIAALISRMAVSEKRICLLEQELAAADAYIVALSAGKLGAARRTDFERDTAAWDACLLKLGEIEGRVSLRKTAEQVLRR